MIGLKNGTLHGLVVNVHKMDASLEVIEEFSLWEHEDSLAVGNQLWIQEVCIKYPLL